MLLLNTYKRMGVDYTGLDAILQSLKYVKSKRNALTLGRQSMNINIDNANTLLKKYKIIDTLDIDKYSESLFKLLGFNEIDSVDNNAYEGATIIHNFNMEIKSEKTYDYIFDGGTTEHIFNQPQVFENIINLLNIDGIFCSVTTNNNFSGHGMYQFSPELYLSCFTEKYGMKICQIYLVEVHKDISNSIDVNTFNNGSIEGRNMAKFNSLNEVYIVTIAQKISNNRKNLISDPPNQFSYENIDWIK